MLYLPPLTNPPSSAYPHLVQGPVIEVVDLRADPWFVVVADVVVNHAGTPTPVTIAAGALRVIP